MRFSISFFVVLSGLHAKYNDTAVFLRTKKKKLGYFIKFYKDFFVDFKDHLD